MNKDQNNKIVGWKRDKRRWHKRVYHTYSNVIFGWVAWICLSISDFFAEYLDFFTMDGKIEKSHGGAPPGPRGSAPASVRRFAPHSGLRSAPRARRCTPVWFLNFTTHREKKSRYQQKSPRYQAYARYQPKKRRYLYNICYLGYFWYPLIFFRIFLGKVACFFF